jgi:hypothetical protein
MFYEHISRQTENWFRLRHLQNVLVRAAFINLFILALMGVALRAYALYEMPLAYKNFLHAHSHFAFAGWVMPMLTWLITRYFPAAGNVNGFHWRNIIYGNLFTAYGMLLTFPFMGYAPASILFSTANILCGFYLAVVLWKATANEKNSLPVKFLRAGLVYMTISAIGPFATAPLIAMGQQGSNLYFDAIYFYLHFQYNGWFTFVLLAVLYQYLKEQINPRYGNLVFRLMNIACVPAFFLSMLWHKPGMVFNIIGGSAALLQIVAFYFLMKDAVHLKWKSKFVSGLASLAFAAFGIKLILQIQSAMPSVAALAFSERNFVIAYLHLVLLGFISIGAFAFMLNTLAATISWRIPLRIFITGFVITEALLVAQAICSTQHIFIPYFPQWIFIMTLLLPVGAGWMVCRCFGFSIKRKLAWGMASQGFRL